MKEVVSATIVKTEGECVKNSGRGDGNGDCSGMPTPPASTVKEVLVEPMAEFDEIVYSLHYFS